MLTPRSLRAVFQIACMKGSDVSQKKESHRMNERGAEISFQHSGNICIIKERVIMIRKEFYTALAAAAVAMMLLVAAPFAHAGWSALGTGMNSNVDAFAIDSAGNLYAGGSFSTAGGVSANCIAKWDGTAWSALGTGVNNSVQALACDSAGNLYAGGEQAWTIMAMPLLLTAQAISMLQTKLPNGTALHGPLWEQV